MHFDGASGILDENGGVTMNKKQKIIFGAAVASAWVVVLTLAAIFVLPNWENWFSKEEGQPEETLEAVFDVLTGKENNEPLLLGADGTPVTVSAPSGMAALISQSLHYEILETAADGETATASVKITAPDTVELVQLSLTQMEEYSEELFLIRMEDLLTDEPPMREVTVEVELVKQDGNWYLVNSSAFSDAITGGMISRYAELQQMIRDSMAGGWDE